MKLLKWFGKKNLKTWLIPGALGVFLFVLAACGGSAAPTAGPATAVDTSQPSVPVFPGGDSAADQLVAAQESVMIRIYLKALPSVVNVQVIQGREGNDGSGEFPNVPGVPDDLREQVFFPLVTGRGDGTGLGLSIAQSLLHQHDGLIEFASVPGDTTFSLIVPVENGT